MNDEGPIVYIVLPCYNGEKYLLEQLMSVYYQNYTNWYLIFVNDGSTDNSENILRDWISHYKLHEKVKVITKENGGVNSAVQRGLEEIKNMCDIHDTDNLVAYCDADDIRTRGKLEVQVNYMIDHPECDLSYHDLMEMDENGISKGPCLSHLYPKRNNLFLFTMVPYLTSTEIIFRQKYIDLILPMPKGFGIFQDQWTNYVFGLNQLKINFINQCLAYYRIGHSSLLKKLNDTDLKTKYTVHMQYFYALKERFPEKNMSYILSYNEDKYINWLNKGYPHIYVYILMLFKYPDIFRLKLKIRTWKLFKF